MRESIGTCKACGKELYCLDGFFNGVVRDTKEIYCFDCNEAATKTEENPQS